MGIILVGCLLALLGCKLLRLRIGGTTKCSRIARGFGFGCGMASVAEPSPQCFD